MPRRDVHPRRAARRASGIIRDLRRRLRRAIRLPPRARRRPLRSATPGALERAPERVRHRWPQRCGKAEAASSTLRFARRSLACQRPPRLPERQSHTMPNWRRAGPCQPRVTLRDAHAANQGCDPIADQTEKWAWREMRAASLDEQRANWALPGKMLLSLGCSSMPSRCVHHQINRLHYTINRGCASGSCWNRSRLPVPVGADFEPRRRKRYTRKDG